MGHSVAERGRHHVQRLGNFWPHEQSCLVSRMASSKFSALCNGGHRIRSPPIFILHTVFQLFRTVIVLRHIGKKLNSDASASFQYRKYTDRFNMAMMAHPRVSHTFKRVSSLRALCNPWPWFPGLNSNIFKTSCFKYDELC